MAPLLLAERRFDMSGVRGTDGAGRKPWFTPPAGSTHYPDGGAAQGSGRGGSQKQSREQSLKRKHCEHCWFCPGVLAEWGGGGKEGSVVPTENCEGKESTVFRINENAPALLSRGEAQRTEVTHCVSPWQGCWCRHGGYFLILF